MARKKRILIGKGKKEINKLIEETGMKYVTIPNGLFDDIYCKSEVKGVIQQEGEDGKKQWVESDTKFTELELIVFIFLQFMMLNKFTLTYTQFADYIGCSSKQLKVVLKRLQHFKGITNSRYSKYEDKMIVEDENEVPLISEKVHTAYNPKTKKNQKTLHWYTNYIPNHKVVKDKASKPINFFIVTFSDFNLLIDGKLTRNEFITYLFLLKAYKPSVDDNHQMYWKLSTIAEHLNYKLTSTIHSHIEKLLDLHIGETALLKEIRPKNYDSQIDKGEEPSSRYIPIFNPQKLREMDLEKSETSLPEVEMSSNQREINVENNEINISDKETNLNNQEIILSEKETDNQKKEMTEEEMEAMFEEMDIDLRNDFLNPRRTRDSGFRSTL
ncbi:hypothetical protein ACTQ5K_02840 [Niallia sp. Sow4_A1]|uniref:hypothetical protein n=1 Tax=Niallia sp. Sow4_A1 TaxID=3438793 RepID=UPI003F946BF1